MKKYVKPELFYENFELTQQVAICQYDLNHTKPDNCNSFIGGEDSDFPGLIVLTDMCDTYIEDYCYHGSTGGHSIFNS